MAGKYLFASSEKSHSYIDGLTRGSARRVRPGAPAFKDMLAPGFTGDDGMQDNVGKVMRDLKRLPRRW